MYKSEHGQDKWLNENVFKNKANGVFVEFGALDGVLHSNSLFYERELNWKGLCIEPNPHAFDLLKKNRNCIVENYAISDEEGIEKFLLFKGGLLGWSGLVNSIESQHMDRINKHISEKDRSVINVRCILLQELLARHDIFKIDYMTIDTEGSEYDIVKTFDFNKYDVDVFDIENNFHNYPIENLMNSKGYKKIKRLDINDIYIKDASWTYQKN